MHSAMYPLTTKRRLQKAILAIELVIILTLTMVLLDIARSSFGDIPLRGDEFKPAHTINKAPPLQCPWQQKRLQHLY